MHVWSVDYVIRLLWRIYKTPDYPGRSNRFKLSLKINLENVL